MSVLRSRTLFTTGFNTSHPFHHQRCFWTWIGGNGDFEGAPSPAGTSVLPMSGARTAKFFTGKTGPVKSSPKRKAEANTGGPKRVKGC